MKLQLITSHHRTLPNLLMILTGACGDWSHWTIDDGQWRKLDLMGDIAAYIYRHSRMCVRHIFCNACQWSIWILYTNMHHSSPFKFVRRTMYQNSLTKFTLLPVPSLLFIVFFYAESFFFFCQTMKIIQNEAENEPKITQKSTKIFYREQPRLISPFGGSKSQAQPARNVSNWLWISLVP